MQANEANKLKTLQFHFIEHVLYVQKNHNDHLLWSSVEHKIPDCPYFNSCPRAALACFASPDFSNECSVNSWSGLQEEPCVPDACSPH